MMINRNKRIRSFSGFLFAFLLFASAPAMAQEHNTAKIYVTVALAVPGGDQIDPRLGSVQEDFKNTFRQASYEMLDEMRFDLVLQEDKSHPLPGGYQLAVKYLGSTVGQITLNVIIAQETRQLLNTNFSIAKGGTIIVGGPPYKEGNLVLAIKATT